jgi:3-methyladenine DNA glycosylase AlkC
MAEPLKNMYHTGFFISIAPIMESTIPKFEAKNFISRIFSGDWDRLELKQRVRQIANVLDQNLEGSQTEKLDTLIELSANFGRSGLSAPSFPLIFLADYIEQFGVDLFEKSMQAIEEVTKVVSCEFAIRPFLIRYPEKTMKQMMQWSHHPDANVRRLSSEGCRPRLPWGMGVPSLKADPSPIIPILENLKNDQSEYVRRSVANNFHDIAKDHPGLILALLKSWAGQNDNTDWIIRHASRTLTKRGDKSALYLQGISVNSKCRLNKFNWSKIVVAPGPLEFSFDFISLSRSGTKFRIDYSVDYLTSTGKISTKIFRIKEGVFEKDESVSIRKRLLFKDLTTRKHFPGKHAITILINGRKERTGKFEVLGTEFSKNS